MIYTGYVMGYTSFSWSDKVNRRLEYHSSIYRNVWEVVLILGQTLYGLFLGWHCYSALMNPSAGVRKQSGLIYVSIVFFLLSANNYTQVIHDREYVQLINRFMTFITVQKERKYHFMPRSFFPLKIFHFC